MILLVDVPPRVEIVQLVDVRGAILRLLVHVLLRVLEPADEIVGAMSNVVDGGGVDYRRRW